MSMSVSPFSIQLPSGYALSAGPSGNLNSSASGGAAATGTTTTSTATNPVDVISTTWNAGRFTAAAGDVYQLSDLFQAKPPAGTTTAGYRLALGDGDGQLLLNGVDVTTRTSFTADEFSKLTYTAGTDGSQQSLVVVAQTGKRLSNGSLSQIVDSPAVQITAAVTGDRSINAMSALRSTPSTVDANIVGIVKEAAILTGIGASGRPTLQTAGNFTAAAGDVYHLSDLFQANAPSGTTTAGYRLALGGGDGQLLLNGVDVTTRTSFTADEFSKLTYTAGTDGSQQSLVVVAQTGKRLPNGTLSRTVDSPAVQITAGVTGNRSINAMSALRSTPSAADANIVSIVKEAAILTGVGGSARSTLQTAGNFTAAAGDVYHLSDLFQAKAPIGTTTAGYRLALGDGDGQLLLNGVDVTTRTSFTADEFSKLTYTAGTDGSQQSLVVVAQTGKRLSNGSLSQIVDSPAVQITAAVTGDRSINAMSALRSTPSTVDANIVGIVKEAAILTGIGASGRPTLQTAGNFTAAAGDVYHLSDLFQANAPSGTTTAGYRLALGSGDGQLLLNGVDVTTRTSFTADEFSKLTYTAGTDGSQQSLVVVAQTGKRLPNGTLSRTVDSPAVQITAGVTGNRSINAMSALRSTPSAADANIVSIVKEAAILTGVGGSARSTLQTAGNFTAAAGDVYHLSDLFQAKAPIGTTTAGYRLALGDGDGQLLLNGVDVTTRTSFTADEFSKLTYTAGTDGSQQSLVVVAQTGKRLSNGSLSQIVDSPAVQVTAAITGSRSINAMSALRSTPSTADANIVSIVKEAAILTGIGASGRPTLQTAITPESSLSPAALSTVTGAYDIAGSSAGGSLIDLSSFDPTAIGSSVSPGILTSPGGSLTVALLLLNDTATGAFQTTNKLIAQSEAIKAYSTT